MIPETTETTYSDDSPFSANSDIASHALEERTRSPKSLVQHGLPDPGNLQSNTIPTNDDISAVLALASASSTYALPGFGSEYGGYSQRTLEEFARLIQQVAESPIRLSIFGETSSTLMSMVRPQTHLLLRVLESYMRPESSVVTREASSADIESAICSGVNIELDEESRMFLEVNPDLRSLVERAREKVAEYFPNATPRLEVVYDPEDDSETLVMFVQTEEHWETGDEVYERFLEGWWLDQIPRVGTRFTVTMDYV